MTAPDIDHPKVPERAAPGTNDSRLAEIDSLRGLAAMAVVLFHGTTRFLELYPAVPIPTLTFPHGHLGVNLFFIISGFVIFMTLDKTRRPLDFVVSRFSRLFPAYWVAIVMTFVITHALGLPGKLVDADQAMANFMMLHGLFKVPHVDGVYWTLEVELLFYIGMLFAYRIRMLERIELFLLGLLAIRIVYFVLQERFGIELPWTIYRLMILKFIPWFCIGISIYLTISRHHALRRQRSAFAASMAVITLLITEGAVVAALAVIFGLVVFAAATGRLPFLKLSPLVWLGSISYPLYLLHENIGWSIQLQLLSRGWPIDLTVAVSIVAGLALAQGLSRWVERPAMNWIRRSYKMRTKPAMQ